MARDKTPPGTKTPTRDRVLDAAERCLAQGGAAFSMRELADEAGVSFATPFNQFGSKGAIMLALSGRRIALMRERLARSALPSETVGRVLAAVDIATAVMLEAPAVNRAVMGAIGSPGEITGDVLRQSSALWAEALGTGDSLTASMPAFALARLPNQLAIAFRGVLSFWTAGELSDPMLGKQARAAAATVLLGFARRDDRTALIALLQGGDH